MNEITKFADNETLLSNNTKEFLKMTSQYQKMLRGSKTPKKEIDRRAGKGGKFFEYVKRDAVFRWFDSNFISWDVEVQFEKVKTTGMILSVPVRFEGIDSFGRKRVITLVGSAEYNNNNAMSYDKAAETDALKRIAVALGGFNDVYTKFEEDTDASTRTDFILEEFFPVLAERLLEDSSYTIEQAKQALNFILTKDYDRKDIISKFIKWKDNGIKRSDQ